jgi:hypothetical protein
MAENFCNFFDHLVYFVVIGFISRQFDIFYGKLVIFFPFWFIVSRKIWQP